MKAISIRNNGYELSGNPFSISESFKQDTYLLADPNRHALSDRHPLPARGLPHGRKLPSERRQPPNEELPPVQGQVTLLYLHSITGNDQLRFGLYYSLKLQEANIISFESNQSVKEQACEILFLNNFRPYLQGQKMSVQGMKCFVIPFEDRSGGLFGAEWIVSFALASRRSFPLAQNRYNNAYVLFYIVYAAPGR